MPRRIHALWPTVLTLLSLVLAYFGERTFVAAPWRWPLDGAAVLGLLVAVSVRAVELVSTPKDERIVPRTLTLATAGALLALLGFGLTLVLESPRALSAVWALWPVLLALSVSTLVGLELAVAPVAYAESYEVDRVENARSRSAGLALLGAVLFFANLLAARHPAKWELSAGSQAVASSVTLGVAEALSDEVSVVLFFPKANEVGDRVERYFEPLAAASPHLSVRRVDHALAFDLEPKTTVTENGYVAVLRGTAEKKLRVGTEPRRAKSALRRLDRDVLGALVEVTSPARVAYLTVGHGERADLTPDKEDRRPAVTWVRKQLEAWQFRLEPFGLGQGSASEVPEDASLIVILGPELPFLDAEFRVLERAIARGTRVLLALEAERYDGQLDPLLARLGLSFDSTLLANARSHVELSRTPADRLLLWTSDYSAHPSVTTMTRNSQLTTVFARTGALAVADTSSTTKVIEGLSTRIVLESKDDTFEDIDGDLDRDPNEPEGRFGLAAALTTTASSAEGRVFVLADVDALADPIVKGSPGNQYLFRDIIAWLQLEDAPAVPTVTEKDVRIVHKSDSDALLFYGTSFALPLLVLVVGFVATRRRKTK